MDGGAPHVQITAIPARFSPPFSLLRHSAPRTIFKKKFYFNFVNPHAAILKRRVGIAGINSTAVCNTF
jgi:hypothetical protein